MKCHTTRVNLMVGSRAYRYQDGPMNKMAFAGDSLEFQLISHDSKHVLSSVTRQAPFMRPVHHCKMQCPVLSLLYPLALKLQTR
jgi:hypothetical protein